MKIEGYMSISDEEAHQHSPWVGIRGTKDCDIGVVGWIKLDKLLGNSKWLAMVMELMGLVKFWEVVMKVENCWVSVMLYKVMGGGVHDFSFSKDCRPILKCPLVVGSKMICLGYNKDLWSQRSKYKSYVALRVQSGGKGLSPGVV